MTTTHALAENIGDFGIEHFLSEYEGQIKRMASKFPAQVGRDDLVQEGRIALWSAFRNWEQRASFWTYARRSVMSAMVTFASRRLNEPSAPRADENVPFPPFEDTTEMCVFLSECLERLPEVHREVLLGFAAGETLAEIATRAGKQPVKQYGTRALAAAFKAFGDVAQCAG